MKSKCEVFGILNVTPDSFSDGGEFLTPAKAIEHAEEMIAQGADFVDVGGQSTRPGVKEITWQKEWARVEEILIHFLVGNRHSCSLHDKISLDTFHPEVAERFLKMGGRILNDVSGFQDERMIELASEFDLVIVNHFPGETSSVVHEQKICSINQVRDELLVQKQQLVEAGISSEKIILDPGIGFGKTMELNWELLRFPSLVPEERVMIGHSRKRFLGEARFTIEENLEAAQIAIDAGVAFLRVHDVGEHQKLLKNM